MITATCPECRQTVVVDSGVVHVCYAPSPLEAENAKLRADLDAMAKRYNAILDAKNEEVVRLNQENAKLRAERNEALGKAADEKARADTEEERWRDTVLKARQARDLADLQNGAWEKLVRAAADQLYALGKHLRGEDAATGTTLQVISTELHRACQVIKGEDPLPHAGGRLTEKQECEHRWISLANRMQACEKCPATRSLQP